MEDYTSADLWRLHESGITWRQLAVRTGRSIESLRSEVKRFKKKSLLQRKTTTEEHPQFFEINNTAAETQLFPPFDASKANSISFTSRNTVIPAGDTSPDDEPIYIPGKANAFLIGDLHVRKHHVRMLERVVAMKRQYFEGINTLILGGDLLDFSSISNFTHNERSEEINKSILLAGDVLRALCEPFEKCVIVSGNHDERVGRKLGVHWTLDLTINAALGKNWPKCEIVVSNLDYCYLGENWLVGHPSSYSGQGGKTPSDLADLYQKNVVTFHNHVIGTAQSKSGKYIGIDAGAMTKEGYHYYNHRRLSKFSKWNSGFCVLRNDFPYVFSEKFTDWEFYGL